MLWSEYVASHLQGDNQKTLAQRAGVDETTLSMWIRGRTWPTYERAVTFARGVGDSPITALVIAGLITPEEADMPRGLPDITDVDSLTLVAELHRRIAAG